MYESLFPSRFSFVSLRASGDFFFIIRFYEFLEQANVSSAGDSRLLFTEEMSLKKWLSYGESHPSQDKERPLMVTLPVRHKKTERMLSSSLSINLMVPSEHTTVWTLKTPVIKDIVTKRGLSRVDRVAESTHNTRWNLRYTPMWQTKQHAIQRVLTEMTAYSVYRYILYISIRSIIYGVLQNI